MNPNNRLPFHSPGRPPHSGYRHPSQQPFNPPPAFQQHQQYNQHQQPPPPHFQRPIFHPESPFPHQRPYYTDQHQQRYHSPQQRPQGFEAPRQQFHHHPEQQQYQAQHAYQTQSPWQHHSQGQSQGHGQQPRQGQGQNQGQGQSDHQGQGQQLLNVPNEPSVRPQQQKQQAQQGHLLLERSYQHKGSAVDFARPADKSGASPAESTKHDALTTDRTKSKVKPLEGSAGSKRRKKQKQPTKSAACDEAIAAEGDNKGVSRKEHTKQLAKELHDQDMRKELEEKLGPELLSTIFLPPQSFSSAHTVQEHESLPVYVQKELKINDSNLACDRSELDVQRCLKVITEVTGEKLCVIFNYPFDNYLSKFPSKRKQDSLQKGKSGNLGSVARGEETGDLVPTAAEERDSQLSPSLPLVSSKDLSDQSPNSRSPKFDPRKQFQKLKDIFPTPQDLDKLSKRGDFDVLIISPSQGCIVMETKAVGYNQPVHLDTVKDKVKQAVGQLMKEELVLRHLFSDLVSDLPVKKVMAFPNVSKADLISACTASDLEKELCSCLSAKSLDEATSKVLCADVWSGERELMPSHNVLLQWWENVTKEDNSWCGSDGGAEARVTGPGPKLQQAVYEQILARLAGPYSKMTVESKKGAAEARTVADCVHLTGLRYGRHILNEDQLEILDSKDQFVYLTGPPGSGKTLMLGLKGIDWAKKGDHVIVFIPKGVGWGSLVSQTLYQRIKEYASEVSPPSNAGDHIPESTHLTVASESALSVNKEDVATGTSSVDFMINPQQESSNKAALSADQLQSDSELRQSLSNRSTIQRSEDVDGPSDQMSQSGNCHTTTKHTIEDKGVKIHTVEEAVSFPVNVNTGTIQKTDGSAEDCIKAKPDKPEAAQVKVHKATVQKTEDTAKFVKDLLDRYSDRPVRIIVDEGPTKVDVEHQHRILEGAKTRMEDSRKELQKLLEDMQNGEGSVSSKREDTVPASSESEVEEGGKKNDEIKSLLDKIRHHLHTSSDRLNVLNPSHGRPLVTQSAIWQSHITDIVSAHRDISDLLILVDTHGTTGCDSFTANSTLGTSANSDAGKNTSEVSETSRPRGTANTLIVLEKLVGEMLEVSGRLYNVETSLDFFVISDVFSLLAKERSREVSVWSSGVSYFYQPPDFEHKKLTRCLRCPPTVQQVLDMVEKDMADCPHYRYQVNSLHDDRFPLPTDGPEVKLLNHGSHMTKVKDILDCRQCGDDLADYLVNKLRVGSMGGLQPDDVIISGSLDINNLRGRPFLQALEAKGIQLQEEQKEPTSLPPYPGKAFVIGGCPVQGLESTVVVFIPDVSRILKDTKDLKQFRPDLPDWLKNMGRWNRCHLWFVASRCLSQLIVFHV